MKTGEPLDQTNASPEPTDMKINLINKRLQDAGLPTLTDQEEKFARELLGKGLSIDQVIEEIKKRRMSQSPIPKSGV
jgi:hypothetical protein